MSTTTSLKLPPELKNRVTEAAEGLGVSAHAFMVNAIEDATRASELRQQFVSDALDARNRYQRDGIAYDSRDIHEYFLARVAGKKTARPKAVK